MHSISPELSEGGGAGQWDNNGGEKEALADPRQAALIDQTAASMHGYVKS